MRQRLAAATQTLAGAAVMITVVTILSRIMGFARSLVQANVVGTEGVANSYAAANVLPNVLFEVAAGGALAGAVVPLLVGPLLRKARTEVNDIASALLSWAVLVLVPLGIGLAIFARPVVSLLPEVGTGAQADIAAQFLVIFAIQVPLYGIGVVLSGVLQANRRFFWPAAAPMLSSVVVIGAYFVFGSLAHGNQEHPELLSSAALGWLAWGTTAGVAVMSLPLFVPAWRTGVRFRPVLRFPPGVARRAKKLAFVGIGALLAQQASVLAVMFAALEFGGHKAFNIYQYAQAVYVLPYAILAVPLATSAFPRLAARAESGDQIGFARLSALATRAVLAVSALGVAWLIAVAPAVETFFSGFTTGGVDGMAVAIAWSAPGLAGFALVFHLSRTLYALDAGRSAVVGAATGWFVVAILAVVFPATLTHGTDNLRVTLAAIGAANTIGMLTAGVLLLLALRRRAGAVAAEGIGRTSLVLTIGVVAGASLGRVVSSLVLPDGAAMFVAAGLGVLVAVLVALVFGAVLVLGDRSVFAIIRGRKAAAPGTNGSGVLDETCVSESPPAPEIEENS